MQYLRDITNQDVSLGLKVGNFPWLKDGISDDERWGLRYLKDITAEIPASGEKLASLSWVGEAISEKEHGALRYLSNLHSEDSSLGAQVVAMPFLGNDLQDHDETALYSLGFLQAKYPSELELVVSQDWYSDGVSDDEASFITTLGRADQYFTPPDLRDFVIAHHVESRKVTLPLSGEIDLTFIQATADDGNSDIVAQVEEAMQEIEEFIGVPFPTSDAILLFASGNGPVFQSDWWGLHRGTHMVVQPGLARQGDTNRVLIHEVAHYYWGASEAPLWFREGGPDFLSSYVRDKLYDDSLSDRGIYDLPTQNNYCSAVNMGTLQKLIDRLESDGHATFSESEFFICNYYLGENFFYEMYNTLGSAQFRLAWGELYRLSQDEDRQITEDDIYAAFLRQTTGSNVGEFRQLYADLHGGVFSE